MRIVNKRCVHCKSIYSYQRSGHGDYTFNNDRYCPECYKVILKALKHVNIKFEKAKYPTMEITTEEFKQKYEEHIKSSILVLHRVRFGKPINFEYKDLKIRGINYTLITNTYTGEELLEAEYMQDTKTKELVDYWRDYETIF